MPDVNPSLATIEAKIHEQVDRLSNNQGSQTDVYVDKQAFLKVVLAGEKIMVDPTTHANMQMVKNPDAVRAKPAEQVANGVTGLMYLMFMQSKQTMDKNVLIMAGVVLLTKAIDLVSRSLQIPFTDEMIANATQIMAQGLFERLKITPEMLQQAVDKGHEEIQAYEKQAEAQKNGTGLLAGGA